MLAAGSNRRFVTVGVDQSPEALVASHFAAGEAFARGCGLLVAHAYQPADAPASQSTAEVMAGAQTGEDLINHVIEQIGIDAAVEVERRLARDTPYWMLRRLEAVSEVVVLGHQSVLVGAEPPVTSLTGRLAAELRCPIATVPRSWTPLAEPRPVVVALDMDAAADTALAYAYATAARAPADLLILHAMSDPDRPADVAQRRAFFDAMVSSQSSTYPEMTVRTLIVTGDPRPHLIEASWSAFQLILGQPHRGGLSPRWYHSTARGVLEASQCPVVLVPPPSTAAA